jgi:hypothetical protein
VAIPKEMPDDIKSKLVEGLKAIITEPEFKKHEKFRTPNSIFRS